MGRRIEYDGEPVITAAEVATQCRVDLQDLETILVEQVIIPGVIGQAESRTGAAIRPAVYEDIWPESYGSGHSLDVGGADEVLQVSRLEDDGSATLLDVGHRLERGQRESCLFFPAGRPSGRLLIRYHAAVDLVAYPSVRLWLLMHCGTAHEYRETMITGTILAELPSSYTDSMLADVAVPPRF